MRTEAASRFGRDFSAVRVHEGMPSQAAGAEAATVGQDIYFAPGRYAPNTPNGRLLLAHELTHVVQQSTPGGGASSAEHETEAEQLAGRFLTGGERLAASRAAVPGLQCKKGGYPKTVTIDQAEVIVGSTTEETEAKQIVADLKNLYGIAFDSAKGQQAVRSKVVGDPDDPQSVQDMLSQKPREKVKDKIQTVSWTMQQLRALKQGLAYFSPVLGMGRSMSTRMGTPQELLTVSRLSTGLNEANTATDSSVLGEYFSSDSNAAIYDSAGSSTELADKKNALVGVVVHEAAHAMLGYGVPRFVSDLNPAYWKDEKTATKDAKAEAPVTSYGTKNAREDLADAAMFYFLEPTTLQTKCPQRYAIIASLVGGWKRKGP